MQEETILFFGYGANRSKSKIGYIIGHNPGESVGATLEGYVLGIQSLRDIPNPPQEFLQDLYGGSFKAYTAKKGEGVIAGVLFELSPEDFQKIKEWEYEGIWREFIEVEVTSSGGKKIKAITEKSLDNYPVSEIGDGILYSEFDFIRQEGIYIPNKEYQEYYTHEQIEKIKAWLALQAN